MIFLLAACVASSVFGPVTGVVGAARATAGELGAVPGSETARVVMLDDELESRVVPFVRGAIRGDNQPREAVYLDPAAGAVTVSIGRRAAQANRRPAPALLAIAPDWWMIEEGSLASAPPAARRTSAGPAPEPARDSLELVDGRRLIGRLLAPADQDLSGLRWQHPRLGVLTFPLDDVHRYISAAAAASGAVLGPSPSAADDAVVLLNGDHINGYVEGQAIGEAGGPALLEVIPAGDPSNPASKPAAMRIPMDQVATITLANPPRPPQAGQSRLWLSDGSILGVDRLEIDAPTGRVTIGASPAAANLDQAGPATSLEMNQLRAVSFDAPHLSSLSGRPLTAFGPTGDRRIAPPPRVQPVLPDGPSPLDADDIVLPGPMFAEWELPAGAVRIAGWVTLDPASTGWGDCEVSLFLAVPGDSDGVTSGQRLFQARVRGETPALRINLPLSAPTAAGARLRAVVNAAERGPIQDRVSLRRMLILTAPSGPSVPESR